MCIKTVRELCVDLGSKSKAAAMLGVTRCTVQKYYADKEGKDHFVRYESGIPSLFTRLG